MSLNINPYVLKVEDDPERAGFFMVAIYRKDDTNKQRLVGIPLRGVPKEVAKSVQRPLKFAFEYGVGAAREDVVSAIHRLPSHALEAP